MRLKPTLQSHYGIILLRLASRPMAQSYETRNEDERVKLFPRLLALIGSDSAVCFSLGSLPRRLLLLCRFRICRWILDSQP